MSYDNNSSDVNDLKVRLGYAGLGSADDHCAIRNDSFNSADRAVAALRMALRGLASDPSCIEASEERSGP
jgi:hypothetical protein